MHALPSPQPTPKAPFRSSRLTECYCGLAVILAIVVASDAWIWPLDTQANLNVEKPGGDVLKALFFAVGGYAWIIAARSRGAFRLHSILFWALCSYMSLKVLTSESAF